MDGGKGPVTSVILESTATLRATGVGRYFNAAFLGLWLVGWAIGEVVAVGLILAIIIVPILRRREVDLPAFFESWTSAGVPIAIFLFLLVWTAFWTIGGYAALTALLRSLAGKDRVRLVPGGFELTRGAGPFGRTRVIDRADIRRIRMRLHDNALVADTTSGTLLLTDLGTAPERETICRWLRGGLQLPPDNEAIDTEKAPPGWKMQAAEDGGILLRRKSAWLPWLRGEWLVRPGFLKYRRQVGPWTAEYPYDHAQFAIETTTDSDGDDLYRLILRSARGERTIQSAINDDGEIVQCARWFAARTGFALESRR